MPIHVLAVAAALLTSMLLTPAASRLAVHFGVVDYPGPRKVHLAPMPLWGGLAMYGATVLAVVLFSGNLDSAARIQIAAIGVGASVLVLVGSLDDRGVLHHQIKLLVAMPLVALILIAACIQSTVFTGIFGDGLMWVAADIALTVLWVVGIPAAFSILDHMDGLCAGVASLAAAFFLFYAVSEGQVLVGTLAAAVLGASLGFLRWNFNPARIFMGDGGAMFLGFMMATLGLKLRVTGVPDLHAAAIPLFILAVPIFDTTLVTISRTRRHLVPFTSSGKDHTSHRLSNLGLGHKRAVMVLWVVGAMGGGVGVILGQVSLTTGVSVMGIAFVVAGAAIVALERCAFERQGTPKAPAVAPDIER
jgi:UDP-GlcNAc:undecaprenyl-phosphate GlcNAc-1-phosphate transferase